MKNVQIVLLLFTFIVSSITVFAQDSAPSPASHTAPYGFGVSLNTLALDIEGNEVKGTFVGGSMLFTRTHTSLTGRYAPKTNMKNPFTGEEQSAMLFAITQGITKKDLGRWMVPLAVTGEWISTVKKPGDTYSLSAGIGSGLWYDVMENKRLTIRLNVAAAHRWAKLFTFDQPTSFTGTLGFGASVWIGPFQVSADYNVQRALRKGAGSSKGLIARALLFFG